MPEFKMPPASSVDTLWMAIDALSPAVRSGLLDSLSEEKKTLSPFSVAKWADFFHKHGKEFGFQFQNFEYTNYRMEDDITPTYQLPQSFHKEVCKIAMVWMSAYPFQRKDRNREDANLRLLEPFLIPIISLFQGRILDKPKEGTIKTKYSTGSRVEHEMFLVGGVLFLVIELKLCLGLGNGLADYIAQLFLELLSAAERNGQYDFKNLKVYGLLSDFSQYRFYTYDPKTKKFFKNEEMKISDETIDGICKGMMQVCNKIFGLLLTAYIDGLKTIVGWSRDRAAIEDYSSKSSSPFHVPMTEDMSSSDERDGHGSRKSTLPWDTALGLAEVCRRKFEEPVIDLDGMEKRGIEALDKLTKSASSMPVNFLWRNEPTMPADREKFADDLTARVYEAHLREASERTGNSAVRVHKRERDSDPEVDEDYSHPELGLRRSTRFIKSSRLN